MVLTACYWCASCVYVCIISQPYFASSVSSHPYLASSNKGQVGIQTLSLSTIFSGLDLKYPQKDYGIIHKQAL